MAEKETPNEKRLRRQKEIDDMKLSAYGMSSERDNAYRKLKNALTGENDYGTELSAGAEYARNQEANRAFKEDVPAPTIRALMSNYPSVMRAGREAAAEERREARGKKKGGVIGSASKRGDGITQRGKTKGRVV